MVELIMAVTIGVVVLTLVQQLLLGTMQSLASASVRGKSHADFIILREYLSRDVQHSEAFVPSVTIDGDYYQTETWVTADELVLRLPAIDGDGNELSGVYDFIVYQTEAVDASTASLSRAVFTNRGITGEALDLETGSARNSEDRILVAELLIPSIASNIDALFVLNQPIIDLAREIVFTATLQADENTFSHRTFTQTYTARFRMRNG